MTLVNVAGPDGTERHVEATSELINSLPLGPGDLVSLLDAAELCDSEATGVLMGHARSDQLEALKLRLGPVRTLRKAKIVPYTLEKQGLS